MIRRLNQNDIDEFIKIRNDSLRLHPKSFGADSDQKIDREQTLERLSSPDKENFILGYFENDSVIGMLGFVREQKIKFRHKGFIWGVFVYPEHNWKGIGSALFEECFKKVTQLEGLTKITLTVTSASNNALALYQKMGFQEFGLEKNAMQWEGEFFDLIYMDKILSV